MAVVDREQHPILSRILHQLLWLLLVLGLSILFFLAWGILFQPLPVMAKIVQIEEPGGHIVYRSQHSLRDDTGKAWQVVLFKQVLADTVDGASALNLRLVGLPGAAEVDHPLPLKITSSDGKEWTAIDLFAREAPAPTIGQYNVRDVVEELPVEQLSLAIPLGGNRSITLSVPSGVVQEWQEVAAKG